MIAFFRAQRNNIETIRSRKFSGHNRHLVQNFYAIADHGIETQFWHAMKTKQRVSIDRERCKGCELCIPVCPQHLLIMAAGLNRKGFHFSETARPEACIGCLKCARMCPDAAIEILDVP